MVTKTRNDFPLLLRHLGLLGDAAEIGVAEGYFSYHLLDHWPGRCWQIDPWRILDEPGYSVHGENDQDARFGRILERAKKYKGRCVPYRDASVDAAPSFGDASFDFIYIDANHTLAAVRQDLRLWWPKLKSGGVFAGHDYLDGVIATGDYGVKTAVTEFAGEHKLPVNVTQEKDYPSWWVRKP